MHDRVVPQLQWMRAPTSQKHFDQKKVQYLRPNS